MCGSAETTQKSKRSRSFPINRYRESQQKQLRRVSGAEVHKGTKIAVTGRKQLRRVSGAEVIPSKHSQSIKRNNSEE